MDRRTIVSSSVLAIAALFVWHKPLPEVIAEPVQDPDESHRLQRIEHSDAYECVHETDEADSVSVELITGPNHPTIQVGFDQQWDAERNFTISLPTKSGLGSFDVLGARATTTVLWHRGASKLITTVTFSEPVRLKLYRSREWISDLVVVAHPIGH